MQDIRYQIGWPVKDIQWKIWDLKQRSQVWDIGYQIGWPGKDFRLETEIGYDQWKISDATTLPYALSHYLPCPCYLWSCSPAVVAHCTGGETSHKMQNNATSPSSPTTSSDIRSVKDFRLEWNVIILCNRCIKCCSQLIRQNPTSWYSHDRKQIVQNRQVWQWDSTTLFLAPWYADPANRQIW